MSTIDSIGGGSQSLGISQAQVALTNTNTQIANTATSLLSPDTTNVSGGTLLSSQTSQSQATLTAITQAASQAQTASDAIQQETKLVTQLQQLVTQASSGNLTPSELAQAADIERQLAEIPATTAFNGELLLDGSYNNTLGQATGSGDGGPSLSIPDLSPQGLGIANLDITSPGAESQLQNASNILQTAQANVDSFAGDLENAGATTQSELANYAAANSTLEPDDITLASMLSQQDAEQQVQVGVLAQANDGLSAVLNLVNSPPTSAS